MSNAFGGATDDVWDRYIDLLEAAPTAAFGITDYFSCDSSFELIARYKKRYPESSKVFFVNVELRLSEAISAEGKSPHLHVIFDNDEEHCTADKVSKFLSQLVTSRTNSAGAPVTCADLVTLSDFEAASVGFRAVVEALETVFGKHKPYLLVFPAKNDGVKSADQGSPRKMAITEEIDKGCHAFFGDAKSGEYFLKTNRYDGSIPKPVMAGSDAHSFADIERLEGNVANFPATWIKADLTFRGLSQICYEPESRVFIGDEPPVERRKAEQPTKILSRLGIRQKPGYKGEKGIWFKNVDIPLNPELTAIIGNKGSGKSALVDILGLLGESRLESHFGFLSDSPRNKKFKQKGYAENFEAEATWHSNTSSKKNLAESVDTTRPETVRYLPQNYFEQLTNEIEIDKFRREIEDVVFSHVEETEKMEMASFKELQDLKTLQSKDETSALKARVRQLNNDIVELEGKSAPHFMKGLRAQLASKKEELRALEAAAPAEVPKPAAQTPEHQQQAKIIEERTGALEALKAAEGKVVEQISQKKNRHQRLISFKDGLSNLSTSIATSTQTLNETAKGLGLDINAIIYTRIDITAVDAAITSVRADISLLESRTTTEINKQTDFTTLASLPDIRAAIDLHAGWIEELRTLLSAPQRRYQTYLDKLAAWNGLKLAITGADSDPAPDTINALDQQIRYIEEDVGDKIDEVRKARTELADLIFSSKKKILKFYTDVKSSVETKLSEVRTEDFSVQIDAAFVPDREFADELLGKINKSRRGPFHGSKNPEGVLRTLLNDVNWNEFSTIDAFAAKIVEIMKGNDDNGAYSLEEQVDPKDFYDFLYSLDYFSASYELRLGSKNLDELSPGEKGLLLLVFYLQLDTDNTPLIIDQPEDNLDNDSIFSILANCIRHAKKSRQVILVTHNPNLAVGADAEQIVYVKLDKARNYKFSYESGSIEDPAINNRIVMVLEGSQPAFVKRRLKYQIA
ncbi:hypothetical protein NKI67_09735 [Mesorhizobium sp. M0408]